MTELFNANSPAKRVSLNIELYYCAVDMFVIATPIAF